MKDVRAFGGGQRPAYGGGMGMGGYGRWKLWRRRLWRSRRWHGYGRRRRRKLWWQLWQSQRPGWSEQLVVNASRQAKPPLDHFHLFRFSEYFTFLSADGSGFGGSNERVAHSKYYTQISMIDSVDFSRTELHCIGVGRRRSGSKRLWHQLLLLNTLTPVSEEQDVTLLRSTLNDIGYPTGSCFGQTQTDVAAH